MFRCQNGWSLLSHPHLSHPSPCLFFSSRPCWECSKVGYAWDPWKVKNVSHFQELAISRMNGRLSNSNCLFQVGYPCWKKRHEYSSNLKYCSWYGHRSEQVLFPCKRLVNLSEKENLVSSVQNWQTKFWKKTNMLCFFYLARKICGSSKLLPFLNDQYLSLSAPPGWGNPSLKPLKGCTVDPEMGEKWFSENQTRKLANPSWWSSHIQSMMVFDTLLVKKYQLKVSHLKCKNLSCKVIPFSIPNNHQRFVAPAAVGSAFAAAFNLLLKRSGRKWKF